MEEALNYIKEESFNMQVEQEKKATASIIAKPTKGAGKLSANSSTGSLTSLRRNKRGSLREACTAGGDDALSTELDDGTGRSEVSGRSLRSAEVKAEEQSEDSSSKGYDELWCSHCLDDKSVLLCAFCGCKVLHSLILSRELRFRLIISDCFLFYFICRSATGSTTPIS